MSASVPSLIRDLLIEADWVSSGDVARAAGVTRQAAHYHLRRLVDSGELEPVGAGRGRRYRRRSLWAARFETAGLQEDAVWDELRTNVPALGDLPEGGREVARFGVQEMVNNAIDHSGSLDVDVSVAVTDEGLLFFVSDEGVGAFEHVRRNKGLRDHLEALQNIAKGKLTTDPDRHTGQGIFFTSKAVDLFVLACNGWRWTVDAARNDEAVGRIRPHKGTRIQLLVTKSRPHSLKKVFDEYTNPDDLSFDKTRSVVRLFERGVAFVSRAEAKRLTANLERFGEVTIDFAGIDQIGQAFADEIFRVWARSHPEVTLTPVNMNEAVAFFVDRARADAAHGSDL